MTVKELIDALKKVPQDAYVCVDKIQDYDGSSFEIKSVSHLVGGEGVDEPYVQLLINEDC